MAKFKWQKLKTITIPEIACRGRQEVSKWLERKGWLKETEAASESVLKKILPEMPPGSPFRTGTLLLNRFQDRLAEHFFEGPVGGSTRILIERMPEACSRILQTADAVCQGRFNLLGYRGLSFGNPVDWHLDPVSGRRSPLVHWSLIDPLNLEEAGDSKVVWELNRHQWSIQLGQAYRLTGEERYAEMFCVYFREWMRANPQGMGINWASSLEVSFRLISWCWALFLFRRSKAFSSELCGEMLGGIWSHAEHVQKYLSYYFAPNTHLTGEALGLFYAGILFSEVKPEWRNLGMQILVERLLQHVLPDGVYFEQSTCYQRYTAEIYLHFLILAAKNGIAVPEMIEERIQLLLDF